jgi:hypothetical protein
LVGCSPPFFNGMVVALYLFRAGASLPDGSGPSFTAAALDLAISEGLMHWFLRTSDRPPTPRFFRPVLEKLEDRLAPAVFGGTVGADFTNPTALQASAGGSAQAFVGASPTLTFTGADFQASGPLTNGIMNGVPGQISNPQTSAAYPLTHWQYGADLSADTPGAGRTPALMEYSSTALVTFIPPQPVPPRAVTQFAPSGGGPPPAAQAPEGGNAPGQGKPAAPAPPAPGNNPPPGKQPAPPGKGGEAPTNPPPNQNNSTSLNAPNQDSSREDSSSKAGAGADAAWIDFLADSTSAHTGPFGGFLAGDLLGERIPDDILALAGAEE